MTFDLRYPVIILFLLSACTTLATTTTYGVGTTAILVPEDSILVIKSICITGNKKTKEKILIRELPVNVGDQIYHSTLDSMLERCKQQLVNLGLFNVVRVTHTQHEGESEINIFVIERWYSWPIPIFQIADRNFNQWWIEKDLQRINYGIELAQFNLRGRNETLRLKIQNGFTRKVEATYTFPWIDRKQRLGLSFKVTYLGNREVWHTTVNNKLEFYRDNDRDMLNRFTTGVTLKIRPKFFNSNYISLFYNDVEIDDKVLTFNKDYLLNSRTSQKAFVFSYSFVRDRRDYKYYPLKGHYSLIEIGHTGLGLSKDVNIAQLNVTHNRYFHIKGPNYMALGFRSKISLPEKQAYFNYRALGYTDFVRGYEYYVIDGQHSFLLKSAFNRRVFRKEIAFPYIPLKLLQAVPFDIYLSAFSDYGYAVNNLYQTSNSFANTLLVGYGLGVNFVAYYDRILRAEVAVNKENRAGLYLHLYYPL